MFGEQDKAFTADPISARGDDVSLDARSVEILPAPSTNAARDTDSAFLAAPSHLH
jgi:hypothetical protein